MRRPVRPFTRLAVAGSLCGVLAGCASKGTPPPDEQPPDRIVMTGGSAANSKGAPGGGTIGNDNGLVVHATDYYTGINARIHAPASSIMDTLSGVYQDLGIPITTRMSTTGQIGNRSYKVPGHRLKNIQLSRILDCGQGTIAGSPVDVDQITLNVISTIKPATDSGSVVNTYVTAFARSLTSSTDPAQCASSGTLERMINDRLVKAFGGSAAD
jgi:hypothetical protein